MRHFKERLAEGWLEVSLPAVFFVLVGVGQAIRER